ncbi:MAG: AAA family ATPase, partial [Pyrinomonadaceae bacterium]|nr:AAA family ATPase [Pyrinomonadaceae bacterium]
MFKLQRLEITGFKSFADYTEIVFTGNGITAVVGPNGCGKSNVSDSISWVLGEQRAKSLRGAEMKDVVFQGTKSRKPSGMAEVVLHMVRDEDAFDVDDQELEDIDETLSNIDELAVDVDALEAEQNSSGQEPVATEPVEVADGEIGAEALTVGDIEVEKVQAAQVGSVHTVEKTVRTKRHWRPRSFALDFAPGEAVSVTRRLYLSGESEYLLNGKTCRLRDIQDLFAGTGLSGSHYAIIEQGRIGQILSAKPGDRRNLIEEAAGISKFRTRQRAAESRLESAKTNLGRISDIVSEIEKQANSLRRQAAKTRRYVVLQEEFRVLLRQLFAAEGRHLSALIEELGSKLAAAVENEKAFAAKVAAQEEGFREATQNARLAEEALAEVRRQHAQNALERDRADREHRYQSEQILNLSSRSEAIQIEMESTSERQQLAESERKRLEIDEEKESAEADASRLILIEAEKAYSEKVDDVKKIESEMDARRGELIQHTAAVERFDEIGRQLEINVERLTQRADGLGLEGRRAEEAHAEHIAEAEKLGTEVIAEREKLDGLVKEKQEIVSQTAAARDAMRASEEALRSVHSELVRTRNRLETLQELEEKRAVYTPQVQRLSLIHISEPTRQR